MRRTKSVLVSVLALAVSAVLCGCSITSALEHSEEVSDTKEVIASEVVSDVSEQSEISVSSEEESSEISAESSEEESVVSETEEPESSAEDVSSGTESSKPAEQSSKPEESSKPAEQSKPQESSKPAEQSSKPQESSSPVEQSSKPQESSKPAEQSKPQESSAPQSSNTTNKKPAYVEISGIKLTASNLVLYIGDKYRIFAYIEPSNASRTDFIWNWSDDSIISMDSTGTVTAKKIGKVTITAETHNGKKAVCEVEVQKRPPDPPKPKPAKPSETSQPVYKEAPVLEGETVDGSWFDDAVFVGDSVSNMLNLYADNGCLGDAEFLTIACLGYNNALWDLNYRYAVHPSYRGKKVTVDEGVRLTKKKKVFIMLGMNDIGGYGIEGSINGMKKLTDRILAKSPDVQIYIQSVTPLILGMTRRDMLNNKNVAKFNKRAAEVCKERGFVFVNVAEAVSDSNGALIYDYCSDPGYMGLHMNFKGVKVWVEYLKKHVA